MSLACVTSTTIATAGATAWAMARAPSISVSSITGAPAISGTRSEPASAARRAASSTTHAPVRLSSALEAIRPLASSAGGAVDHQRVADLDHRGRVLGVARADVDPEVLHLEARPRSVSLIRCRGPLPITRGRSPVRVRSVTCCPTSTCGSHVPSARPAAVRRSRRLLLDVGDDQTDLVEVPEQQHRRAGLGANPGVGAAEDVTADARERRRIGTPDGRRRLLVARRAVGAQEVVQKRPGRRQHGRDATITLAWIRIRSSSRASGRSRPSERRSRRRGTRCRRAPAGLVRVTLFDPSRIACEVAAEVKGFDAEERFGRREARKMDRVTALSLAAAREAWENAGRPRSTRPAAASCSAPPSAACRPWIEQAAILAERPDRLSPHFLPNFLVDTPTSYIATTCSCAAPTSRSSRRARRAPTRSASRPRCCGAARPT